jgi:S-adenosylmethionine/arginine decarboxylase-like enzyme
MTPEAIEQWLLELIPAIGMKVLAGPYSVYLDQVGNRGLTGVAIIETSHIVAHVWDEDNPGLIQLDVYSCKEFDKETVFKHLDKFEVVSAEWFMLDRTDNIVITDHPTKGISY